MLANQSRSNTGKTDPRSLTGNRCDKRVLLATVQGNQHTVVKLKTKQGKMLTVDMGLVSNSKKVKAGDSINVTGVPANVGDRVILIADKPQS